MEDYHQIVNYLIVLLRDDVDTDELRKTIKAIPSFKILNGNTQKVSFYKNTLDYLIGVGKEYLRIGNKQTRNNVNSTRKADTLETKFKKIREISHDYSERKSINNKYMYGNGGYNVSLDDYMKNVVGELRPIHKKYLEMFGTPATSIKRSRSSLPHHGGTRKKGRTH